MIFRLKIVFSTLLSELLLHKKALNTGLCIINIIKIMEIMENDAAERVYSGDYAEGSPERHQNNEKKEDSLDSDNSEADK